ncbi:MAG: hypothetical protein RIQ41_194 [Candidatus Parcubacteria bacterium]|jgi:peptidoglycan/LPS O-acetylase OafA/YrhL
MKSYYPLLDVLRYFAAFWVMSFHYFLGLSGDLSWYRYGNLGVPLFFIISGFVISQSVAHVTLRSFAVGRFIRLYPLFWIICTCTYIFTLLMPNGHPVLFPEYLISMTMLGEKLGNALGYIHLVDAAYWSLVVELLFYVAIGSFVYLFSWKRIRWFTALWLLISATAFFFHADDSFFAKLLLVRHASYFLFGITLMLVVSTPYSSRVQKFYDYLFLIGVGIYGTLISPFALPPYLTPHPHDTLIVLALQAVFFVSVAALVYLSSYVTREKTIHRMAILGGITYPLYLVHQTVGNTIIDYFKDYGTLALRGGVVMILMIGIAYVAYRYDKKLRHALTRILLPAK